MIRRIIGIETEYGLNVASTTGGEPPLDPETAANILFRPVLERARSTNAFLSNGARLYLDVGAHPEYASAECDEVSDLLANDRAGDSILAAMAAEADTRLAAEGIEARLHLFKNNLDSQGNSYGCHENYLVRRRRDFRERIESLIPFFVSRQIMVGAGHIRRSESGARYEFSQRADQMWDAVSSASTRSRPMINTRDEPHGDAELYRRMHVIVGDSNMLDPTCALKVGSTEAVLNVIEDGVRLPRHDLADPTHAIRVISRDLTASDTVELVDGRHMSGLDLQEAVYDVVRGHYEKRGWFAELDPLRTYVFELWGRVLGALRAGDTSSIDTEIDWAAKKKLLDTYVDRLGTGLDDDRIARLDLAWHDITPAGLRTRLENSGVVRKLVDNETIEKATGIPPQSTRAKLRGDFVALATEQRRDHIVDWMNIRLLDDSGAGHTVTLKDPFANQNDTLEAIMAEMERA